MHNISFGVNPKIIATISINIIIDRNPNSGLAFRTVIRTIAIIAVMMITILFLKNDLIIRSASADFVLIMSICDYFLGMSGYLLDNKYIIYLIVFYIKV